MAFISSPIGITNLYKVSDFGRERKFTRLSGRRGGYHPPARKRFMIAISQQKSKSNACGRMSLLANISPLRTDNFRSPCPKPKRRAEARLFVYSVFLRNYSYSLPIFSSLSNLAAAAFSALSNRAAALSGLD